MARLQKPSPVKLIISVFSQKTSLFELIEKILARKFGPIDFSSQLLNFDHTKYYEKESGRDLKRKFISFKRLLKPDQLWKIKISTNRLEKQFAKDNKRQFNLDPGYISLANLVLASTKNYSHRICIREGIYQEVTLIFKDKTFWPLAWTYPDYQSKECIDIFNQIRNILNLQLK